MKRLAIVLGVDRYEDESVVGLKVAVADAGAFGLWLKELPGSDALRLVSLFGGGTDTTKSAVIRRLRAECRALRSGDELIVFFAGHGCLVESKAAHEHVLLLSESRVGELPYFDEALPVSQLLQITAVEGVRRLFVLDACRDHLRLGRSTQPPEFRGARVLRDLVAHTVPAVDSPVTLVCSCEEGRCAQESSDLGGGLFTLSLLSELRAVVASGRSLVIDGALVGRVGLRMHSQALAAGLMTCQQPWVEVRGLPMPLWRGPNGSSGSPVLDAAGRAEVRAESGRVSDRFGETSRRAWNGDARAQAELGEWYANGEGCPKDAGESLRWYLRAAEQGHTAAMYQVGTALEMGLGCARDPGRAVSWYRRAADLGQAHAMMRLSEMWSRGYAPLREDPAEAFRLMQLAAARGPARAQYQLSMFFEHGRGAPRDLAQARLWAERAAAQGMPEAANRAGVLYETRAREGDPDSWARARDFYRAAATAGLAEGAANAERLERSGVGQARGA